MSVVCVCVRVCVWCGSEKPTLLTRSMSYHVQTRVLTHIYTCMSSQHLDTANTDAQYIIPIVIVNVIVLVVIVVATSTVK